MSFHTKVLVSRLAFSTKQVNSLVGIKQKTLKISSTFKMANSDTYGISSGKTSAKMLIESVLAFDVGAAAKRILRRDIYKK